MALTLKEQQAKNLFLHTDQTQTEIADLLDIDRKTLHLWIKKGMWEQLKRAAEQTPSVILQNIYNHIYQINKKIADRDEDEQCPTMQEIEMLRKLVMMTKAFPQKHTGTYIDVFSEFTIYLLGQNQPLAKEVTPYFDAYVNGVLKDENRDISGYARRVRENLDSDPHFAARKPEPRKEEPKEKKNSEAQDLQDNKVRDISHSLGEGRVDAGHAEQEKPAGNTAWGKNGEFQIDQENALDAAPTNTYEPKDNATNSPSLPLENLNKNGELSAKDAKLPEGFPEEDWSTCPDFVRKAPPHKRPSPYPHKGIVWISHEDDIEKYNRKMSDTVRYFPDVDPVRLHQIATWEQTQRIKRREEHETLIKNLPNPNEDYDRARYIEQFHREAGHGNNSNTITVWKVNRY